MAEHTAADAWRYEEIEPTTLMLAWPDPAQPTFLEVQTLLSQAIGGPVEPMEEFDHEDPAIEWGLLVRLGDREIPVIIWAERASEGAFTADTPEGTVDLLDDCTWLIGFETPLDSEDPLADYARILRALATAVPDSPVVLDVNTTAVHNRDALDQFFAREDVDPPADILWSIHAVAPDEAAGDEPAAWLHTHGLARCGLPELEMLEVPKQLGNEAAHIIHAVAEVLLEQSPPPPGEAFEIGVDLEIALQPWRAVVPYLADGMPGCMDDRMLDDTQEDPVHGGVRAVIVAPVAAGTYRKVWHCPVDVLRRLTHDDVVIFRSHHATERQERIARATWPDFAMAFAHLTARGHAPTAEPNAGPVLLAKVGIRQDTDAETADGGVREHLWFAVLEVTGDNASGQLLNEPLHVAALQQGSQISFHRNQVSDWMIVLNNQQFTPDDTASLARSLEEM